MQYLHLKPNFIKQFFTLILTTGIMLGGLPGAAQTKRGAAKTTQAKTSSTEKNQTAISTPVASAMSKAWQSGVLPPPLALPAGNTDEVAQVLAQKVAARNEESIPALLTALQLAGFFITDKDGQVLHAPPNGRGLGLPINGWELASAAKMFGDGKTVPLGELGETLRAIPELKNADVAGFLLDGVRANAGNQNNSYLRVWARFITELGKNSAAKYDLSRGATVSEVQLDAIQHLLIMRRLYGDSMAISRKFEDKVSKVDFQAPNSELWVSRPGEAGYIKTSYSDADQISANLESKTRNLKPLTVPATDEKQIPCRMDGNAPTIMDAGAEIAGVGFDKFYGYLEDFFEGDRPQPGKIGKFQRAVSIANILLAYAKFVQTYVALETNITAEDSAPLIRTKNAVPGARKNLKAEVRFNIGNWQMYNCIRTALNVTAGIDFATLNDGPAGDIGVQWSLTTGGGGGEYSNRTGVNAGGEAIVGFAARAPRIQDEGVGAGPGTKGIRTRNLTFTKTDDKGIAENVLEGAPQDDAKNGKVTQVMKRARVVTSVKVKAGEIKGDSVDVAGQAIAGVPGLIVMPLEILYRTSWAASGALDVPVIDWEECTGAWTGTVSFVKTIKTDNNTVGPLPSGRGESRVKNDSSWTYKASIQVSGAGARATIDFSDTFNETRETVEKNSCDRGQTWRDMSCSFERRSERSGTGDTDAAVRVTVNRQKGTFSISGGTQPIQGKTGGKETGKCSGQCVPKIIKPDIYEPSIVEIEGQGFTIPEQQFDPNSDTISGTYTSPNQYGATLIVTWNLRKCGAQANLLDPQSESKLETYAGNVSNAGGFSERTSLFKPIDTFSLLFAH